MENKQFGDGALWVGDIVTMTAADTLTGCTMQILTCWRLKHFLVTNVVINGAAFHCQQSIEKGLKGYLLFKKHKLYDGHNLTWLCKQAMQTDSHFSTWLEKSTMLNHYYIETRYPADIPFDIDTDTIMELIHSASEMLSFITEIIHFDFRSYHKR